MTRRSVDSDGVAISFLDSGGTGPPVVILHGLAGSATEFIATAQALPHHRVLLVDQRGHGHSTRTSADTSLVAAATSGDRTSPAHRMTPTSMPSTTGSR